MDEKALNWIADVVNEAIAKATAPLTEHIARLEAQLGEQAASVKTLLNPEVQDDTFVDDVWWKIEDRVKALIPAAYDASPLRQELNAALDETAKALVRQDEIRIEQGKRISTVVEGVQAIKDRIEEVAKSAPAAYDDTALRAEVAEAMKFQTSAMESVAEQVKELSERQAPTPADGRDALQLEVLPAIDEQKSYTRGTYAKHAGGLWRSFEQTSGMRGWECIVDGVASLTAEMQGKSLVVRAIQSSGTEAILHAALPVQTYKGVFAHGEHEQGDTVTWGGNIWHCNVTGTKALPGDGSSDWTLAVKKGRDGREVVKTERKPEPVRLNGNPLQNLQGFIENGGAE